MEQYMHVIEFIRNTNSSANRNLIYGISGDLYDTKKLKHKLFDASQ